MIDVSKRIEVEDGYNVEGSFNLAYVSEIRATIPTLVYSFFNKNWNVLKKEEVIYPNETEKDAYFRDHILLEEGNQNALIVAFLKASKKVDISQQKVYVTYIDPEAKTDLKIGDQILKIDNTPITNKKMLFEFLKSKKAGDTIQLQVEHGGSEHSRYATMFEVNDRVLIGMMISEIKEIKPEQDVTFHFKSSESGPSGGLMLSLSIYNYLIPEDITHGLKIGGTGTIDENGTVGSIGGVAYKIMGAVKAKADLFFVPTGENYEEAKKLVEERNYKLTLVPVGTIDEAIDYLNHYDD